VIARGQANLRKDVLQYLGIRPGEKIELDLLPDDLSVLEAGGDFVDGVIAYEGTWLGHTIG